MPPLAAVALAHAVDHLKGFSSEVTLETCKVSNTSPLEQRRPQHPHRHWTVFQDLCNFRPQKGLQAEVDEAEAASTFWSLPLSASHRVFHLPACGQQLRCSTAPCSQIWLLIGARRGCCSSAPTSRDLRDAACMRLSPNALQQLEVRRFGTAGFRWLENSHTHL